jgi:flagellar basal-body rod protein FlgC
MSLFNLLSVSASGMAVQRLRAQTIVENLANAETTRTPGGGPYRRKDVVVASEPQSSPFGSIFQSELNSGVTGAGVAEVLEDARPPELRYEPGHPDANAEGYVAYPHISPAEEMADLMNASRSYHANVAAMSAVKDMVAKSIDLLRS